MTVKFLDLHAQYQSIRADIDAAIAEVIAESAFINGRHVRAFEANFGAWVGAANCVGVANGTDAIEIALEALDLPPGSEVILPANTFIATSEAVSRSGLKVVFADIDPESYTLTVDTVAEKLSEQTSAIVAVHLYGHPCDMEGLNDFAARHGLRVIEDSAQAHGATVNGQKVGTLGDLATFSFYPGKNLGAYGDAGAVTTRDADLAKRVRMIANHGRVAKYDHEFEGRNSRLDGLQAAILSAKLPYLDGWLDRRVSVAARYVEHLHGVGDLILPTCRNWARHVYHLFVVRTSRRDQLAEFLRGRGIDTGVHYPIALPRLGAYRNHPQASDRFFAADASSTLLSLPIGEHMTDDDVDETVRGVRDFFGN